MNEIIKIKISEIDDFKNHPYKVELGDELNDLVESIKSSPFKFYIYSIYKKYGIMYLRGGQ